MSQLPTLREEGSEDFELSIRSDPGALDASKGGSRMSRVVADPIAGVYGSDGEDDDESDDGQPRGMSFGLKSSASEDKRAERKRPPPTLAAMKSMKLPSRTRSQPATTVSLHSSFRRSNSGPATSAAQPSSSSSAYSPTFSVDTDLNKSFRAQNKMPDFNSLSRSSRHLADSIVNRSMALARFTSRASNVEDDSSNSVQLAQQPKRNIYRGYVVGDSVLVSNHQSRWASLVNRFGYPPGQGTTEEEKKGPYMYVLAKVKRVHFEEYSVYYTVTREDTGADMRGEAETMEPIRSVAGEEAARKAAREFVPGGPDDDDDQLEATDPSEMTGGAKCWRCVESVCVFLLLPFLWLYDCFIFVIGARLFRWGQALFIATRRQAHLFLNGMKPYQCSSKITAVNLTVLCSFWYMFIDQARLAFMPVKADRTLAIINFVIWTILVVELIFEVFIRPDKFTELIVSDKAFTPTTVRFISFLHLFVESISLVFFVPEFVCLFTDANCDDRSSLSFLSSVLLAITSSDRIHALAGRAFFACIRLRVFGLVRHWKNMWVKRTFTKRFKYNNKYQSAKKPKMYNHREGTTNADMEEEPSAPVKARSLAVMAKAREAALINASNIGTALMVTNSYRTLMILCAIMGLFPMITLIYLRGVTNPVANDMVQQLQAINILAKNSRHETCDFLVSSVQTWVDSWQTPRQRSFTSPSKEFLVSMVIQPARCSENFTHAFKENMNQNYTARKVSCQELQAQFDTDAGEGDCIFVGLKREFDSAFDNTVDNSFDTSLRETASNLDLRFGALQTVTSGQNLHSFTFENGTSRENAPFEVVANFNHTYSIESSALSSFLLQMSLLITVLGGLSILRKDAEVLVLGPLRSMLKIVAQYAKNPLSSTRTSKSEGSDGDSDAGDSDDEADGHQVGNYETEQLITAVSKITDLLRKCWGVAGADIISTNLVSRDGTFAEVFNPTVPGKSVYALFAFAAIGGFDHALKSLGGDVMILINDVALVLHGEVYRWGFGKSGQCNKNLGAAFLMVFRIGLVKEVVEKLEEATAVVFDGAGAAKRAAPKRRVKATSAALKKEGGGTGVSGLRAMSRGMTHQLRGKTSKHDSMDQAMQLSLQSLPGISTFTDRAVIGMLKSFAGIHRDTKLRAWGRDFRLSAGVGAFNVTMIFGMDAGWAVEGAVGSEHKIDATYLSPHVNMASRMMSACKHYGVTILFSEAVQELMSDAAKSKLRNLDRVTVKGSSRIQKIFTYDARSKGADFFLFSRSDEQADMEAERYVPNIWSTDQDLTAMRHHVTDDFEQEYSAGLKAYYDGDWPAAIAKLENANEIMVEAAMEEGYLHDELDDSPDRKEMYRTETADGPCSYLVNFMKSKGGVAPEGWAGWHPLLSK